MVLALLKESDMPLSEDIVESIVNKVLDCSIYFIIFCTPLDITCK